MLKVAIMVLSSPKYFISIEIEISAILLSLFGTEWAYFYPLVLLKLDFFGRIFIKTFQKIFSKWRHKLSLFDTIQLAEACGAKISAFFSFFQTPCQIGLWKVQLLGSSEV